MHAQSHVVTVTTAADGSATAYTPTIPYGRVVNVIYAKTDFSNGVDFTITGDVTGQNIWTESDVNASKTCAPRQPTHSQAGVAALYAGGGAAVNDLIRVVNERIKIVIASGGNTTTGTFTFILE